VQQKGSLVDPERLRFDFSHFEPVTPQQLHEIETLVNDQIRANAAVETRIMPVDQAMQMGAMALFGEKYGDQVRVLSIGDFSVELCGGTHVTRAGDIGVFKILSETGIAAGVRRIEAVTGARALDYIDATEKGLSEVAGLVKAGRDEAAAKVSQLLDRNRRLERNWRRSRPNWPVPRAAIWRARRRRSAASRCWPRAWKGPTPRSCATPSTS
jgi:alanyl-tRNA synthetase